MLSRDPIVQKNQRLGFGSEGLWEYNTWFPDYNTHTVKMEVKPILSIIHFRDGKKGAQWKNIYILKIILKFIYYASFYKYIIVSYDKK